MIIHDLIHSCRIYNPLIDVKLRMERATQLVNRNEPAFLALVFQQCLTHCYRVFNRQPY
ncbi:hypothetical protein T4E_4077 [Trichinella pseudospiralis]|uniref:Uncharacterized protein n=1 Tax=Trichinella pseudospiralis TaxID=6337 RepID=A0A0V0Y9G6_TRIPS|nr:hypothetical protein T4E_4077 [Trichinella pseudospiralis]